MAKNKRIRAKILQKCYNLPRKEVMLMAKVYLEKNVLEAAFDRLEIIFNNFENVYFSVSGGKDSSVMVQLANMVAKKIEQKI